MKNKKILIISCILIVVACAIIATLYFTTDLFKTNQQLFYKYITETKIMNVDFVNQYKLANEKIIKNSSSSVTEMKLITETAQQGSVETETEEVFKISSNGLKNTLLKQSYRDFTLSSNNQNFITLKYLRDDNTYGVMADNIVTKYLAVENANLKNFFAKLGVKDTSTIPDSISTNYEEILKIDQAILNQLKENYGTLIYNNINEENFYKISNEDKTQTIGISLSEKELIDIAKIILETAKKDDVLLNLIISKAQQLNYTNITIENIQLQIQNIIDKIINEEYSTEKDFVKFSLIKKDKEVIKIQLEMNTKKESYNNEQIASPNIEYNKKTIELELLEPNKYTATMKENDNLLGAINIIYSYNENDINIVCEAIDSKNEKIIEIQYHLSGYQMNSILQKCQINLCTPLLENSITALEYDQNNIKTTYKIEFNNQIELKQDVQISKLTTENSAKLNDMTSEQLEQLFIALGNRINQLYGGSYNDNILQHAQNAQEEYERNAEYENQEIQNYENSIN